MHSRYILNFILLAFVVLLLAHLLPTSNKPAAESNTVSDINPNTITTITVERENRGPIRFARQGQQWKMNAPLVAYANEARINSMLRTLQSDSYVRLNTGEIQLENLGLSNPSAILKLNEHLITLGTTSPLDGRRYIRLDRFVYLVDDNLYPQLLQDPLFFISRRLLPGLTRITAIAFPEVTLFHENHVWRALPQGGINNEDIAAVVDRWQTAQALNIAYYRQMPAEKTIVVSMDKGESILFDIISTGPKLIFGRKDSGIAYHFNQNAIAGFFPENKIDAVE